jgi:AraC-like DNA-binding protein
MTKSLTQSKQLSRPSPTQVPAAVARDLLRIVAQTEGDAEPFLRRAGLAHLIAILKPEGRAPALSRHDFAQLYAWATEVLDARAARQEGRHSLTKAGVDVMCQSIITARTVREVIERLTRFSKLMAPRTGVLTLAIMGEKACLTMATVRSVRNACAYMSDLTGLAFHHRLLGWLIGEDIRLSGAALRYRPLIARKTIAYLLPIPVKHDAPENSLSFPAYYLDRPIVRSALELDRMLGRFPFDIGEPQSKNMPLSERIDHVFASLLASGEPLVTADLLARRLNISLATLKRRLAAEGSSLSRLKTQARREQAELLLADPKLSVTEVGRRTQFSDAGAFRRAFTLWTGQSPTDWRRRQAGEVAPMGAVR